MSTLEERLRSLRDGRVLLAAIVSGDALSPALRDLVAGALQRYPDDQAIHHRLRGTEASQALAWGEALAVTRTLIEALMERRPGDDPWRQWARGVDRHFPEARYLPSGITSCERWSAVFLDPCVGLESGS